MSVLLFMLAILLVFTSPPERRDQPGWTEVAEMPTARGELSAAVGTREQGCQDPPCEVVVLVGGFAFPFTTSDRVDVYFPDEDRWARLPDMPGARHHLAAAALPDGTIVVTGGAASAMNWEPESNAWALAPDSDEWVELDPLPEPRWGHRLVAVDDRLILVGGHGGSDTFIWSEDDGWTVGAPIPKPRDHLGAVNVDGEVWVIGGRDDETTNRVDIYDPDTDEWREGPPLPAPTSAAAVGLIDRTLVAVAGEDDALFGGGMIRESWMLNVDEVDAGWRPLVRPPMDMHGAGDAVVGEGDEARFLILGGAGRHGAFSPLSWSDQVMVLDEPLVRED